ncbi:MAG: hypothetical protein SFU25_08120 [Candidatus Caenarcaniphilales bacterium]|nr:hypothetical protein [Candidatus Caenarcaniphilales bacterium]
MDSDRRSESADKHWEEAQQHSVRRAEQLEQGDYVGAAGSTAQAAVSAVQTGVDKAVGFVSNLLGG